MESIAQLHPVAQTIEELSALSDEELRVRCAELCGFRLEMRSPPFSPEPDLPKTCRYWYNIHSRTLGGFGDDALPNYPADLNAMHEAEKMLSRDEAHLYADTLLSVVRDESPCVSECVDGKPWALRWTWHATARQRCIAFIATKQAA